MQLEADQIWRQAGIINPGADEKSKEKQVTIFNETGKIVQTIKIPSIDFARQFAEDPENPKTYIRKVRIDQVKNGKVSYIPLDVNNESFASSRVVQQELYLHQHMFNEADQQPQEN